MTHVCVTNLNIAKKEKMKHCYTIQISESVRQVLKIRLENGIKATYSIIIELKDACSSTTQNSAAR